MLDGNFATVHPPYSQAVWDSWSSGNIRIYDECEGRIEKFVSRIAVWHHEACRVMTNGDSKGHIFLSFSHTNNGFFFSCSPLFFI